MTKLSAEQRQTIVAMATRRNDDGRWAYRLAQIAKIFGVQRARVSQLIAHAAPRKKAGPRWSPPPQSAALYRVLAKKIPASEARELVERHDLRRGEQPV